MLSSHRVICAVTFSILALFSSVAFAQVVEHPLRPPKTASPQATLQAFVTAIDTVYAIATQPDAKGSDTILPLRRAAATIDMSLFPPEIRRSQSIEVALLLDEIFDRIGRPDVAQAPSVDDEPPNKWRIPNTPITIALVESGPRSGEYLFSANTAQNIREYYDAIRDLPYIDTSSPGLYTAYVTTPGPGIALGWSERLPDWSKQVIFEQTYWQWIALAVVTILLTVQFIPILRASRSLGATETQDQERAKRLTQLATLLVALALTTAAAWFVDGIVNLTGDIQITVAYVLAVLRFVLLGWIIVVAGNVFVDLVSWARGLEPNSAGVLLLTVASWIVVGLFTFCAHSRGRTKVRFPGLFSRNRSRRWRYCHRAWCTSIGSGYLVRRIFPDGRCLSQRRMRAGG